MCARIRKLFQWCIMSCQAHLEYIPKIVDIWVFGKLMYTRTNCDYSGKAYSKIINANITLILWLKWKEMVCKTVLEHHFRRINVILHWDSNIMIHIKHICMWYFLRSWYFHLKEKNEREDYIKRACSGDSFFSERFIFFFHLFVSSWSEFCCCCRTIYIQHII